MRTKGTIPAVVHELEATLEYGDSRRLHQGGRSAASTPTEAPLSRPEFQQIAQFNVGRVPAAQ